MEIIKDMINNKSVSILFHNIIERKYTYFSNCMLGPYKENDIVLTLKHIL